MVTLALIAINLAAFALELAQGGEVDAFVRRWGLVPADVFGAEGRAALATLLTSTLAISFWGRVRTRPRSRTLLPSTSMKISACEARSGS